MTEEIEVKPHVHLEQMINDKDYQKLVRYIDEMPVSQIVHSLSRLSLEDQNQILSLLEVNDAADLVAYMPGPMAVDLIRNMPPADAARILEALKSNERAGLLGEFKTEEAEAIFDEMDTQSASVTRLLAQYPRDVAGGIMITEHLWYHESATVDDVIKDFRNNADLYSDYDIQYAYIINEIGILTGVLRLRDLLLAPVRKPIADIMIKNPLKVLDTQDLSSLGSFFAENNFIGVPIVDDAGRLIGVVRRVDVDAALMGQSENDYLKSQGIVGGEEFRSMPVWRRSYRRLSWLSINIVLNLIAVSVIAAFQDTLAAVIALAVFIPIISDMSGCTGYQAAAVSNRELSLGLVMPFELFRVWIKEISVGIIIAVSLGLLLGLVAWVWKGNPYLGIVIGSAMGINTLISVSMGGTIPLILKWLNFDPALASGPILTTVTDMCGFLLLLGIATMMIGHL